MLMPQPVSQTIQFIRRGEVVTLSNVPPTRTLLEVLREDLGYTQTLRAVGDVLRDQLPGPEADGVSRKDDRHGRGHGPISI
mgnify:CR=1 FL=1